MHVDSVYGRVFLKARNPAIIHKCLPGVVEEVDWHGHNLAVEHTVESTKVLRNLGIKVPSPIRYKYNWPGRYTPFSHQIDTSEFLTLHRKCFVLSEMGTAKSASALWAADYLMLERLVRKVLIVGPLSTLERVWLEEIFNVVMHRTAVVLHGTAERRLELLGSDATFYIINYEGLDIIRPALAKRDDIDLIIVDEAAAYRNGSNHRYKVLEQCIQPKQRLWLMTGTPCPNAPTDAWALARLIDKTKVPTYFTSWKRQTMQQVSTYKWRSRVGSNDMVYNVLQPAIRFAKKDCLDLPPVTYESRQVEITPEQMKAFRRMQQYMATEASGHQIDAVNAADKINKLRQILLGVVKDPETGEYVPLPYKPRLSVLLECIEQASAKVIVVVPFKGIIQSLYENVSKTYTTEIVNGDVPPARRNKIYTRFRTETHPHTLLCHPQVMAHGLNLTEADTLIFYGPIYSNDQSQQVMERMNRPGQTRPMTIIRMGGNQLEWDIYHIVEDRKLSQQTILDLYRKYALQS